MVDRMTVERLAEMIETSFDKQIEETVEAIRAGFVVTGSPLMPQTQIGFIVNDQVFAQAMARIEAEDHSANSETDQQEGADDADMVLRLWR
jgi:hypothetical protein